MDLILWRHAEAQEAELGQTDDSRALTSRGERQAQRMAAWLNQHLPASTRVLVSPTQRTQQTAAALERRVKIVDALAPLTTVDAVLAAARWPTSREPVLIVGHQPTLGLIAARLLADIDQSWIVKKGAIWWLRQRDRDGDSQVVLQAALAPDMA